MPTIGSSVWNLGLPRQVYGATGSTWLLGLPNQDVQFTLPRVTSAGRIYSTGEALVLATGQAASADYSVQAVLDDLSGAIAGIGIAGRMTSVAGVRNGYFVIANPDPTVLTFTLSKFVNSVQTNLGTSSSQTRASAKTLELRMQGTTISVYYDGAQILSVTDSDISQIGYTGIRTTTAGSVSTGIQITQITTAAISGGGGATASVEIATRTRTALESSATPGAANASVEVAIRTRTAIEASASPGAAIVSAEIATRTRAALEATANPGAIIASVEVAIRTRTANEATATTGNFVTGEIAIRTRTALEATANPGAVVADSEIAERIRTAVEATANPGAVVAAVEIATRTRIALEATATTPSTRAPGRRTARVIRAKKIAEVVPWY